MHMYITPADHGPWGHEHCEALTHMHFKMGDVIIQQGQDLLLLSEAQGGKGSDHDVGGWECLSKIKGTVSPL